MAKSIMLGGRPAKSLDTGARGRPIHESRFASPLPERIDVDGLVAAVGLRTDEQKFIQAKADGLRGRDLANELGWSAKRVAAVRRRVARKLEAFDASAHNPDNFIVRGNSRVLSYKEHLSNGYFCYSLAKLGPEFVEIMKRERGYVAPGRKQRSQRKTFVA